uniref:Transmembrane protein n=1 Tax=Glossina austeni TaxID=7395 RepID=A0A1A9UGE8_GLOAU
MRSEGKFASMMCPDTITTTTTRNTPKRIFGRGLTVITTELFEFEVYVEWSVGSADWLARWLAGWLAGWLAVWLVGWQSNGWWQALYYFKVSRTLFINKNEGNHASK